MQYNADVLIVDGVTEQYRAKFCFSADVWSTRGPHVRRTVLVTSDQLKSGGEDQEDTRVFNSTSWSLDEFRQACRHDEFYDQVRVKLNPGTLDRDEAVERKFSMTGGSVRWMFGMAEDEAEEDINSWISSCTDMRLITNGMQGNRSPTTVNHLLSRNREGKCWIISRYVALKLSTRCEAAFVSEASSLSMTFANPSWNGWVFQIDFFLQLRMAETNRQGLVLQRQEGSETWTVPNRVEFRDPKDFQGNPVKADPNQESENKKGIKLNDWLIPTKWNQGCYDAAQLLPENSLRIVQVTRAASHSLKLHFVHLLIAPLVSVGFKVDKIDLVFVVPLDEVTKFKLSATKVTGDLRAWGWKLGEERVLGLQRTQSFK